MLQLMMALALQASVQDQDPEFRARIWKNFSARGILDRDEIAGYTLSASEVAHLLVDRIVLDDSTSQSFCERFFRSALAGVPLYYGELALSVTAHEYGHFQAYSKRGVRHFQFLDEDTGSRKETDPLDAYGKMFRQMALRTKRYGAISAEEDQLEFQADPKLFVHNTEFKTMMEAGGLNQEQYDAAKVSEKLLDGRAHILDATTYFMAATGTIRYPTGGNSSAGADPVDYVTELERLGIQSSVRELKYEAQWPKLFSNSALSFLYGIGNYLMTGEKRVAPLQLEIGDCRVYWPEFSSYLTLQGPTIKESLRVGCQDQAFTLSWEKSLSTNSFDVGIGWKGPLTSWLSGEAEWVHHSDGGNWAEGGPVLKIFSWLSLGIKGYHGDGYSFAREIRGLVPDFLEGKERGVKGFLEVHYNF